jgi:ribose/xylose/arabinose/galactoside ABC-type transport system permease subunit
VFAVFSIFSDNFLTANNVRLIFQQYAVYGICVLGVSLVVLLGGIDLSAGSILAVAGSVGGTLVKTGLNPFAAILVAVAMGTLLGFINAVIITKLGVPPIITTLATDFVYRGSLVLVTGGFWVNAFPKTFTRIATGRLLGLSNVFWMAIVLLLAMSYLLYQTNIGRKVYAVGANPEAAGKCGIDVTRVTMIGYSLCGALIGFASMMYAGQYGAISTSGTGANLGTTVLAAALVGGVNFGGLGTLAGASVGMFMISIINNGLIQLKVSEYWIDAITGAIILSALVLNAFNTRQPRRAEV